MKVDLTRITQLIAELQAIDTALAAFGSWRKPYTMLKVNYVTDSGVGTDLQILIPVETAREVLETQRRGVVGLLKMHGLDVE